MPEATATTDTGTGGAGGTTTEPPAGTGTGTGSGTGGADELGPAGERALAAERTARKDAERQYQAAQKELEQLRQQSMTDAEKAVAKAKEEGRSEALAAANQRLLKAEIRVAAAGKLADPGDAIRFLDLDEFKVGDDGEVDSKAVAKAIEQLLKDKPYLAPGGSGRPTGDGGGGPRGGAAPADMNALIRERMRR